MLATLQPCEVVDHTSRYQSETITIEHQLLQQLGHGHTDAFWELWELYRTTLFERCCLRWMDGNLADAEDALSSASICAWQQLPARALDIINIKAWLTRLLYNHCMNIKRANKRHSHRLQPITDTTATPAYHADTTHHSVEDTVMDGEMKTQLYTTIKHLPSHLQTPVILYYFRGIPQSDIAQLLYLSPANVRKRLQQARHLIKIQLQPYHDNNVDAFDENQAAGKRALAADCSNPGTSLGEPPLNGPLPQDQTEIVSQVVAIRAANLRLADGAETSVYLALGQHPTRQQQKLKTLTHYVQQHPRGWRKRAQLAELLYTMGRFAEALALYDRVQQQQPLNLDVCMRRGHLLRLLGRDSDALILYEESMALARHAATKHHLEGHITLCRHRPNMARQAFAAAAALESHNLAHWHMLGLVCLQTDRPLDALQAFNSALKLNADDLVALTGSHDTLVAMGQIKEAQRRLHRVLAVDPKNAFALTRRVQPQCQHNPQESVTRQGNKDILTLALNLRAPQFCAPTAGSPPHPQSS